MPPSAPQPSAPQPPTPILLPVGFNYVTTTVHHNQNAPYDLAIRRTGPKAGTPFLPGLAYHNPSTHHFIILDPPLARHSRALHAHLSQLATTTPLKPKNQSLTQMQLTPIINAFFLGKTLTHEES